MSNIFTGPYSVGFKSEYKKKPFAPKNGKRTKKTKKCKWR